MEDGAGGMHVAKEGVMVIRLLRVSPANFHRGQEAAVELEIPGHCFGGREHDPSQTSDSHRRDCCLRL